MDIGHLVTVNDEGVFMRTLLFTALSLVVLLGSSANAGAEKCNQCISWCNVNSTSDTDAQRCMDRCLAQNFCRDSSSMAESSLLTLSAWNDNGGDTSFPNVQYFSWCEKNKLMEAGKNGAVVVRQDCTKLGLACRDGEKSVGPQIIHFAQCK